MAANPSLSPTPAVLGKRTSTTATGRGVYLTAAIFGLLILSAGGAILLVAATLAGETGFMIFASLLTVVPLVLSALIARFGGWTVIVSGLLALAVFAMHVPFLIEVLGHPDSFFDFAPLVISSTGMVITFLSAIAAVIQQRRRRVSTMLSTGQRRTAIAIVAVLAGVSLLSGVLTITGRTTVSAEAKAGATPVKMSGTKFVQEELTVAAGSKLVVKNSDPGAHSFTIESLDIDVNVGGGSEKLIDLSGVAPGTYEYVCKLFGHESIMKGTLTVTQ